MQRPAVGARGGINMHPADLVSGIVITPDPHPNPADLYVPRHGKNLTNPQGQRAKAVSSRACCTAIGLASSGAAGSSLEDPRAGCRNDVIVAAPSPDDPYTGFNFRVEIEGISRAAFSEVGGLESETAVIEYRVGGERNTVRKLPGLTKYANIVLRRGITQDAELWNWQKNIIEGKADRRNGSIILLDDEGNAVVRWNFVRGWICKWEGPDLNASANEVAIETIAIAHEGLELA
jgi:phage tail-like protein